MRLAFLLVVLVLCPVVFGYGGSYNRVTGEIRLDGHYGVNEYIFLHEQGHAFYYEVMRADERAQFKNNESFANVYGASFECRLKPSADPRIKALLWWLV